MNKQKQNKASLRPMYFQIDREQDKTVNITFEENNMSKCDFVLITADDLQSNDQFKEDENFVKFLITEGIKSGSIGES